jgi:hypothetical protein
MLPGVVDRGVGLSVEVFRGESSAAAEQLVCDTRERVRAIVMRSPNVIDTVLP